MCRETVTMQPQNCKISMASSGRAHWRTPYCYPKTMRGPQNSIGKRRTNWLNMAPPVAGMCGQIFLHFLRNESRDSPFLGRRLKTCFGIFWDFQFWHKHDFWNKSAFFIISPKTATQGNAANASVTHKDSQSLRLGDRGLRVATVGSKKCWTWLRLSQASSGPQSAQKGG